MGNGTGTTTTKLRSRVARGVTISIMVAGGFALPPSGSAQATPSTVTTSSNTVADHDWLGVVNAYRAMSNLSPLVENPTWSAEAELHSRYMLLNGISHDRRV